MTDRSKRRFVRLVVASLASWPLQSERSLAQSSGKMSKEQAQYRNTPNGIQICATCSLFQEPVGCRVVAGDISPNGWCKAYAMAD